MNLLDPIRLSGDLVVLEPLSPDHHDGLVDAVRDGNLWELGYTAVPTPDKMAAEIERRLAEHTAGRMLPFTVVRRDTGAVVGMTTYMNIDGTHRRVEIGSTWIAAAAQRSGVNTECKLLLLGHAFEALDCIAVEFRTHWLNLQSRRAIENLGAKQDGVLRSHQRMPDGSLRDTVVFSVIAVEWPAIRTELRRRLATHAGSAP